MVSPYGGPKMRDYVECKICNKQFSRITPTHLKQHNMTVKEYTSRFGKDPSILSCDSLRKKYSITRESLIERYGEVDGTKRWESYCEKQRVSNTFEYKKQKYGWSKEKFDEYNKSRSITKTNCIKRHGRDRGLVIWNEYVERQKYAGVKLEYFIEKYGADIGTEKYNSMLRAKIYRPNCTNNGIYYSTTSVELFKKLDDTSDFVFYAGKNNEYIIEIEQKLYSIDFFDVRTKRAIEFYGDYWHCNPDKYDPNFFHKQRHKLAREIWELDNSRIETLKKYDNISVLVVWEFDYINNKADTIRKCLEFLYD